MSAAMLATTGAAAVFCALAMAHLFAAAQNQPLRRSPWWELSLMGSCAVGMTLAAAGLGMTTGPGTSDLVIRIAHLPQLLAWTQQATVFILVAAPTLTGDRPAVPRGPINAWELKHHKVAVAGSAGVMILLAITDGLNGWDIGMKLSALIAAPFIITNIISLRIRGQRPDPETQPSEEKPT